MFSPPSLEAIVETTPVAKDGSFVQGQVGQRRLVDSERQDQARRSDLIA
jgi:hypothetical protein